MPTNALSVRYRPIKIGFLVRDGNVEDLVKAAELNTLLWGGIHNPIVPVCKTNKNITDQLLNVFSVDVLIAISHTAEIDAVINQNPYLSHSNYDSENIFYKDFNSDKNILGYLDSINVIYHYWEKEFKNKPVDYKSDFTLVNWNKTDMCSNLFTILFGYFPTDYNLKDDFQNNFLKGLRSKEISITKDGPINESIAKSLTPITATTLELLEYSGSVIRRGDGLYVGSEADFTDLLYFWNLRASGLILKFLPIDHLSRFDDYIRNFLKKLDDAPNRNPSIKDWITVYFRGNDNEIQDLVNKFKGNKSFCFSNCNKSLWNGLNIIPSSFYFDSQQVLSNVDKNYDKYIVTFALPEKKFLTTDQNDREKSILFQSLVASIKPNVEFNYPEHTLKPPFVRKLNEFYSREITFDPWRVRSEQEGIGIIIRASENSLSLFPIYHQKLLEKIFELIGFEASLSQPGLLAKLIVHGMREQNPLEACRVFKIRGVRRLIGSLKADESIKWNDAAKTIGQDCFNKFKDLHIELRDTSELTPNDAFNFLLKKKIFSPKIGFRHKLFRKKWSFKCKNCGLEEKILLKDFEDLWRCTNCKYQHYMPIYIADNFKKHEKNCWNFKKSGLFARDNNQEGAIPVIISLLTFARILDRSKFIYTTSLKLENDMKCEIDFCVLHYDQGKNIQLGIAECKSERQRINQQDIDNLKQVQDKVNRFGFDCYIIFSKTADSYEQDELDLFKSLKNEHRKFVILSNKELEQYHPYWNIDEVNKLPEKYPSDLMGMHRNSLVLYLS